MGSPQIVNVMSFITNGNKFPYALDKKGTKGIVSTESLVGYSKYTSRKLESENTEPQLDIVPGGYYKYTSERPGSTRTYTNEGWKNTQEDLNQFRNYVAQNWQEAGKHAWFPIMSFKDYATASQYGLFKDEDYALIVENTLNRFFKYVGLNPTNMIWWMNYHNNKNHPHVHVAFIEKETTREKGIFTETELKQFKRFLYREMSHRERVLNGTDKIFNNELKMIQLEKQSLQSKSKTLIVQRQDHVLNHEIKTLLDKLPNTSRLQYGSVHMKNFRKDIDKVVALVLEHETIKPEYENLLSKFAKLDEEYGNKFNEEITNMRDSEIKRVHKVIANSILNQKKYEGLYTKDITIDAIKVKHAVVDGKECRGIIHMLQKLQ